MKRYKYKISGLYNDWCQITKNDEVYHDGPLIGLIIPINGDIVITLNFGSSIFYTYKLRFYEDLVIGVPLETEYIKNSRPYIPVIFTKEEFAELRNITYVDEKLLSKITECSHHNLLEIWICTLDGRPLCENFHELNNEIFGNIVAFSDESIDISKLNNILNTPLQIVSNNFLSSKVITIYIDSNKIIEWNSLLLENRDYYLSLDEDFALKQRK
ncbi:MULTISPECIES: hypothetical protein [unclassified Breznakia]|uniref:hypothetical protein n=1 Tax=unclassified Breznakia TaxID=2623764 RepID=UPI002472F068|nr:MULTISPECIES: hypothetical protein [unclassified Breznakia]MDH6367299.1 hypothetical protein [Breznakia sp. PH1-1]MDH6404478.1 hypothetical protein [Breznakia sp. PF1-11]MDH6412131.1 hypothetical protein [Breznakia sp. PFB1-11]MDH6414466.1 hypothetical protein [Breznakia sp. PFB1-14]MDH6416851.1 hypothetical protein [Breznakia sp. PFB1-4]